LYGGASMQTLGRIVEIAGGQRSWESLFQERVAAPLGLTHTGFYGLGKTANPLIGGGAQSSTREFARFLEMIAAGGVFQGKRVLSEKAVALMIRNHAAGVPVLLATNGTVTRKQPPEKAEYGLGVWRVIHLETGELLEVNSQGKWGFSPWVDFRRNVIGILATKSTLKAIAPTYRRIKQIIRDIVPPNVSPKSPPVSNVAK
jgi:serine-type D-Ala-D-Ala carboxypeptidase/endopeptidase